MVRCGGYLVRRSETFFKSFVGHNDFTEIPCKYQRLTENRDGFLFTLFEASVLMFNNELRYDGLYIDQRFFKTACRNFTLSAGIRYKGHWFQHHSTINLAASSTLLSLISILCEKLHFDL